MTKPTQEELIALLRECREHFAAATRYLASDEELFQRGKNLYERIAAVLPSRTKENSDNGGCHHGDKCPCVTGTLPDGSGPQVAQECCELCDGTGRVK